jgi:hypothetical protein
MAPITNEAGGLAQLFEDDSIKKHLNEKLEYLKITKSQVSTVMKHYLACGFNILLYGVGSKRSFINEYTLSQLNGSPRHVVNGYHSACSIKSVTNPLLNFAFKNQNKFADK